jgi:hypothetical protein
VSAGPGSQRSDGVLAGCQVDQQVPLLDDGRGVDDVIGHLHRKRPGCPLGIDERMWRGRTLREPVVELLGPGGQVNRHLRCGRTGGVLLVMPGID